MAGNTKDQVTAAETGKAEKSADKAYEQYIESAADTKSALKNMKGQLGEVKQAADEADAETAARKATAQGQGVVSVTDALKLMEQEKIAKSKYTQAATKYMSEAASAFASSVADGSKVLAQSMIDAGQGIKDGMFSTGGIMSLGAGIAVASLPDAVHSPAAKMVEAWLGLSDKNKLDDGVAEKVIDGYGTPEDAARSAITDNRGSKPGYSGANTGTGPDTDDSNEFQADDNYKPPTDDDATNVSKSELDKMANLDEYLGKITDNLENSDNVLLQSVGKGIDILIESDAGKNVLKAISKGAANRKDKGGAEDDGPEDDGPEDDGPDV